MEKSSKKNNDNIDLKTNLLFLVLQYFFPLSTILSVIT